MLAANKKRIPHAYLCFIEFVQQVKEKLSKPHILSFFLNSFNKSNNAGACMFNSFYDVGLL